MSAPPTVLIVDDEPQILRLVEKMMGARKMNLLLTPRPSEALRISESQPVHLLISDISMPEMDGARLAERILRLHPEAAVLLISGQSKDLPAALRSARVRFLKKPFFPSQLVEIIRELVP